MKLTQAQRNWLFDLFIDLLVQNWQIALQDEEIAKLVKKGSTTTDVMEWLMNEVEKKLKPYGVNAKTFDLNLEANPSETCIATIKGVTHTIAISGKTRLVGKVHLDNNEAVTIYQRFIGKTFYQYVSK